MKPLVLIFAKAPIAGSVKTRLTPELTPEQAAALHEVLVADTWERLGGLEADRELCLGSQTGSWPEMQPRRVQCGGDLGMRMLHELEEGLRSGRPAVAIVGGDVPSVPTEYLRALLESRSDVALGPARDGGFYAIACRRTAGEMFRGVRWSTEWTLEDTRVAAAGCGLSVWIGPEWYDVDRAEDLRNVDRKLLVRAGIATLLEVQEG